MIMYVKICHIKNIKEGEIYYGRFEERKRC